MLEELCKQDELWRHYAFKISGCRDKADDLVQEMYLRFANKQKEINKRYVFRTINSIFIDEIRENKFKKIISLDTLEYDKDVVERLPINHAKVVLELHDKLTEDPNKTKERFELLDILKNELTFFDREVLLITHEYSLRDAEKETNVPYYTLNYYKKKGLKKLKDKYGRAKR